MVFFVVVVVFFLFLFLVFEVQQFFGKFGTVSNAKKNGMNGVYNSFYFSEFEDGYRELKSATFELCEDVSGSTGEEEGVVTILKQKPHEPLFVRTTDGEMSIPRRVFYDIVNAYCPYWREVTSTFTRLAIIIAVIIVLFSLIQIFKVFMNLGTVWTGRQISCRHNSKKLTPQSPPSLYSRILINRIHII